MRPQQWKLTPVGLQSCLPHLTCSIGIYRDIVPWWTSLTRSVQHTNGFSLPAGSGLPLENIGRWTIYFTTCLLNGVHTFLSQCSHPLAINTNSQLAGSLQQYTSLRTAHTELSVGEQAILPTCAGRRPQNRIRSMAAFGDLASGCASALTDLLRFIWTYGVFLQLLIVANQISQVR